MKDIRNKLTFKALTLREAAREKALALRAKALDTTGEGYVDTAVKIIIAVVIGALLMAGLVALFNEVIMPRVNTEVTELFDAAGCWIVLPTAGARFPAALRFGGPEVKHDFYNYFADRGSARRNSDAVFQLRNGGRALHHGI